jgi:iron complex outermembrane receptor protein
MALLPLSQTADGLSIPLYANSGADVHDRIWEQRFWFDSPKGGIVDYTVGVDYWGENLDTFAHDHYYGGSTVTTWYGSNGNTGKYVQRFGELNDDAVSLYANSTWHLNEQLDLITGLRGTGKENRFVPSYQQKRF